MAEDNQDTTEDSADQSTATLPPYLLGTKGEMTQVFTEDGKAHAATVVSAGPITVTQVKTPENDGYAAYQFGYERRSSKNTPQPQQGHMEAALEADEPEEYFAVLREYRLADQQAPEAEVGDSQSADVFTAGDAVHVTGISKGKGFQGVVKRHGFAGGSRTHGGQKAPERGPGSIGATGDSTVEKGSKMAGRAGGKRTTVKNLEIVHVDPEANELYIKGGIPGPTGSLIEITSANE